MHCMVVSSSGRSVCVKMCQVIVYFHCNVSLDIVVVTLAIFTVFRGAMNFSKSVTVHCASSSQADMTSGSAVGACLQAIQGHRSIFLFLCMNTKLYTSTI